jgi:hypothetical protein
MERVNDDRRETGSEMRGVPRRLDDIMRDLQSAADAARNARTLATLKEIGRHAATRKRNAIKASFGR